MDGSLEYVISGSSYGILFEVKFCDSKVLSFCVNYILCYCQIIVNAVITVAHIFTSFSSSFPCEPGFAACLLDSLTFILLLFSKKTFGDICDADFMGILWQKHSKKLRL